MYILYCVTFLYIRKTSERERGGERERKGEEREREGESSREREGERKKETGKERRRGRRRGREGGREGGRERDVYIHCTFIVLFNISVHFGSKNVAMFLVPQYENTGLEIEERREEEEEEEEEEGEGEREVVCVPLESLGLGGNKIGDTGARHLAAGLATNTSESLYLPITRSTSLCHMISSTPVT